MNKNIVFKLKNTNFVFYLLHFLGPAIAGGTLGGLLGLSGAETTALSTAASLGALGALGPGGVGLGALLGGKNHTFKKCSTFSETLTNN